MTTLAAPSLDRLLPFWTEVFGVPEGVFTGVWSAVTESRRRTFFHTEGGEILATVQLYVLPLVGADVACVANVATRESARGRGLSTGLLREAIRWSEGQGFTLSYLFTGVPQHYARLGWAPTEERVRRIESEASPLSPSEPDFRLMASLYANGPQPFAMRRDEAWWANVVLPRLGERLVWTAPDAYVVAQKGDEGLIIEEAVGEPEAVKRLVLGAVAWAGGEALLHGDLDLGTLEARLGGMLRGGPMPEGAWFSTLDHF